MAHRIEVPNPDVRQRLGHVNYALVDFDGTVSVIRQGWEDVMIPTMIEMICVGELPPPEIEREVRQYIDYSTGVLTIRQMEWLAAAVRRYGTSKDPRDPYEYKRIYNERILEHIDGRLRKLLAGEVKPDDLMIMGSRDFLVALNGRGVTMFLASGTDHEYVMREAGALKVTEYFSGGVYGALDRTEANDKEQIIQRILDDNDLKGNELVVIGDGPAEMRNAKSRDAIAVGVASDEVKRCGLNPRKRKRLMEAGADLIISDFTGWRDLIAYLFTAA